METTLGLILQLLILACHIGVCVLGYLVVRRDNAPQKTREPKETEPTLGAKDSALAEEERRMQEQMQKMIDGMNNIFGYDGRQQGDKR